MGDKKICTSELSLPQDIFVAHLFVGQKSSTVLEKNKEKNKKKIRGQKKKKKNKGSATVSKQVNDRFEKRFSNSMFAILILC